MESSRPSRKRVKKLTDEEIQQILGSDSEKSDDPDFDLDVPDERTRKSRAFGAFLTKKSKSPNSSGSDPDDPDDLDDPRPRSSRRGSRAAGRSRRSSGRASRSSENEKKRPSSSSWAPVVNVPPPNPQLDPEPEPSPPRPVAPPVEYKAWDGNVAVIEPAPQSGEKCYYCCVRGCSSANVSDRDGLWLFEMPKEASIMSAWDNRLPLDYERNRPNSPRVCFRHFEKSDFVRRQQRLVGLREGALPNHPDIPDTVPAPRRWSNKRLDYTD
ncbi:unnamed protein product, partial [Ixodes hexagonus]